MLSHPVALDQCRDFFQRHPKIEAVPFYDTAGSVKHVIADQLKDAAGIAGKQAAREYSGKILQSSIEDDKRNFTRFFLIRKLGSRKRGAGKKKGSADYHRLIPRGANKTSIVFQGEEHAGSALQIAQRVCAAGYQLEQDRVAAHAGAAVGVCVLRGLPAR